MPDWCSRHMDGVGTKLKIVILDACCDNPFATRGARAEESGLAEMRAPLARAAQARLR